MSNTSNLINLANDILVSIGITIYKFGYPVSTEGTERIVLNSIPNKQVRFGAEKLNNDLLNINFFVPKINGSPDSKRIETVESAIISAIEAFNISGTTTRVGYSYLDPKPGQVLNHNEKENLLNIRCEATYT